MADSQLDNPATANLMTTGILLHAEAVSFVSHFAAFVSRFDYTYGTNRRLWRAFDRFGRRRGQEHSRYCL